MSYEFDATKNDFSSMNQGLTHNFGFKNKFLKFDFVIINDLDTSNNFD